jgi:hypothetical protein
MTPAGTIPREILRLQRPALLAALAGAVLLVVGLFSTGPQFFRAYLFAWMFCLGLSLGSLAMVMLSHLVNGDFAWLIRRFAEAAAMNLLLVGVLFIPILFGLKYLFPWADEHLVRADKIMQHRAGYMNPTWFTLRYVLYFVIWIGLAWMLRVWSLGYDRKGDIALLRAAQRVSAPGLLLYVVTVTLAAVDWILSRDPHWYSQIIGLLTVVGQAAAAMALLTYVVCKVAGREPISRYIEPRHLNDLGNLLLTLVILWAYMSFAQFLIIWMGNSKEDIGWYAQRGMGYAPNGWRWLGLFLIVFHFFVPFFILLGRDNKRQAQTLGAIAGWLFLMRILDVYWWVAPAGWFPVPHPHGAAPVEHEVIVGKMSWLDVPALLALVGIWMTLFVQNLKGKPLLARGGPEPVDERAAAAAHA